MVTVTTFPKRLCLSKDNYIDLVEAIAPTVLNNVRFLYKQFIKRPGVIINDPPGCDQEMQVVMFIRGIHKGLDQYLKPVLILCHSSKLNIWMDSLRKWMPNYDEVVAIEWAKPTTRKSIYVTTMAQLETYCRRNWGIVVVDDDSFLQYKLPPGAFSSGHFKIFITTDDLRVHLPKFAQIHKFLYPDLDVDINEFRPKKNNMTDLFEKRIWFETFVEDLIVRSNKPGSATKYSKPMPIEDLKNYYKHKLMHDEPVFKPTATLRNIDLLMNEPTATPTPRITKKNKDATGTKIKRTKRKAEDDNTKSANKKIVANAPENINCNVTGAFKVDNDSKENMDIESFIRDSEPIRMDELNYIPDIDNLPLASDRSDVVEVKSEEFEENSNDMKLNYSEDLDTDDAAYDLETQDDDLGNNELESKKSKVGNIISNDNDTTNIVEDNTQTKNFVEYTQIENILNSCGTTKIKEETSALINVAVDSELENEILNSKETNDAQIDNKNETKLESKEEIKPIKENGVKKGGTKSDDLDSKWEEMALKKFKGSLLDRIF